ncbi:MAG: ATP-binding protein [Deltaproteobacteria bacterium]|nr:ATP-binding protein [Deltaproteobacteria bacterium]
MSVTGVQHLVERAYRESGELQYLRELVVNAMEAGATHIEIGPEWSAVEREGVYRLMVADDGKGMGREELLKFLNTFGGGGKPIGDAHENFGVGAKTSLLPWNHHGVVVISWTPEHPDGAMVVLRRDAATGEYGAHKFETAEGEVDEVVVPGEEWAATRPEWIREHGTVVVCLGNTGREDTFVGKAGDGDIKGISAYLNKRLWTIPEGVEIYVQELRTEKRTEWARSFAEASGSGERRWNRRQIRGAAHFVASVQSDKGKLDAHHTMVLEDGTELDWYLWKGERPNVHSYAHKNGFIAALYKNELYDTYSHAARYRSFGITCVFRAMWTLISPSCGHAFRRHVDTERVVLDRSEATSVFAAFFSGLSGSPS